MHLDDVLTELVADSGDRLLRVAYQLTHDRGAAQDLVQDALLRVYRSVRRRGLAPEDWYAYLRRAGELSERQRAVLVLRYYEALADHEIGVLLGCREATVRSLARRGLAALRPLVAAASTEEGRA